MQERHPRLAYAFSLARSGRIAEGMAILHELADAGEPEALFTLAETVWVGGPVAQDHARGRELFRRASEAGHALAAKAFTNLLASGIAGARDWPAALARLADEANSDPQRARILSLVERMEIDEAGDPLRIPTDDRLSEIPFVSLFRDAFTTEECAFLIEIAEPAYRPSLVGDGMGNEIRKQVRTSDGSTIHWLIEDPATHALNRRLAALSGTDADQGEALQVLRYRPGQQYHPHVDWDGGDNGRIMTALAYLNGDYEGGETLFVKTGLKVKGRKGDVLIFRSETEDGRCDLLSEHAGLPVTEGVKYLGSRWIHQRRYAA
jgi:prolyl 4-hydroxylase